MGPNAARSAAVHADAASADFAATVVSRPPSGDDPRAAVPDIGIDSLPMDAVDSMPAAADDAAPAGDPATDEPGLGQIGRYELLRTLGSGGLGTVYEARDPLLSRTVAVKTLQFDAAPGARVALDRLFLNEARAAAGLSHPHIVTVFDAGLSAHGVYIAMERLRGQDLRQALAAGWRPTAAQAVLLARRVADALAYAHARGVVHCDIKPANIFLGRSGKPKLLDFGIARIVRRRQDARGAADVTDAAPTPLDGMVAGSPHYLAPEQLRGEAVDGRTDVYALGVVLYELLTGRKAFVGESVEQIHAAVLSHDPPPADALVPALPSDLARLVAQAMARDPALRPAGAAEFAQLLRPWHAEPDGGATERTPRPAQARALRHRVPPRRLAAAVAMAAAIGVVLALIGDGGEATASVETPSATADADAATAVPPAVVGPGAPVAAATGLVHLSILPGGEIEVDGNPAGRASPAATLELSAGPHLVIVRRDGQPAFIAEVDVRPGLPVSIAHRFDR